jgi:bifunctional non-homologous end joining protein LigD
MSLTLYKQKRRFDETPEPEGREKSSKTSLRFVIQKHDASHVHYDFRLEMEGVLKSWAVPKGPSLNPEDKRLAMMVEDHPYDYRTFEGIIPEGNYGGGTVIVWDEGFYEPMDAAGLSRKEQEKLLLKQLHAGSLKLVMHGSKIKGEYALFLMKGRGERSWILVKKNDRYASKKDITKDERSVKTGKTLVEVAEENGTTVNHPEAHGKKKAKAAPPIQLLDPPPQKKRAPKKASKKAASKSAPSKKKPVKKAAPKKTSPAKSLRSSKPAKSASSFLSALSASSAKSASSVLRKSAMPKDITPMMATLVTEPFDNDQWLFEIKWDGYRAVAYANGADVELVSRNGLSFTEKYFPVTDALKELDIHAVLDGEIVAVDKKGMAVFQSLQNWQNTPVQLQYFIFDLIWLDGYDLSHLPLLERKKILKSILPHGNEVLKYSDHVMGKGLDFFKAALAQGLEGMMAKNADSLYEAGTRTRDWVKVKVNQRQEVVIAGYTEPRNARKFFGSLLLGLYDGDDLVYIGHTGSGFNAKSLEQIYKKLQPLVVKTCPFENCPKGNMPVTWVRPKLVCEIKFTEWTKDRIARHPIFMGLRVDKKAKDVSFEKAVSMEGEKAGSRKQKAGSKKQGLSRPIASGKKEAVSRQVAGGRRLAGSTKQEAKSNKQKAVSSKQKAGPARTDSVGEARSKKQKAISSKQKAGSKELPAKKKAAPAPVVAKASSKKPGLQVDAGSAEDQHIVLNGHDLKLTNLNKLYWKKEKFSKGDMINYYLAIAPYMMPYMLDRPQSLNRHPGGIDGPNFFQKDMKGKVPEWMQTHDDFSESTNQTVEYLVCSNEATLIYMANLGCIEMHPWHARAASWDKPDWCLIDLDPDNSNTFNQVIEVALVVKKILDSIGASACVKTSGSSGIHIYIPLGAKYNYDQSRQLAELVVTLVNQELPDLTSMERSPSKRKGKLYLDYLQNRETQTAAAPYSLRPKPGVPVSTPLDWSEVKKGLTPTTWNARNIFDRLKTEGDLFKPVLGKGINLEKVLRTLAGLQ